MKRFYDNTHPDWYWLPVPDEASVEEFANILRERYGVELEGEELQRTATKILQGYYLKEFLLRGVSLGPLAKLPPGERAEALGSLGIFGRNGGEPPETPRPRNGPGGA